MKLFKKILFAGFFTVVLANMVIAAESNVLFKSMKQIGMGGAAVAICDDEKALYQKPAGLMNITGMKFNLLTLRGGVSTDGISNYKTISDLLNAKGKTSDYVSNLIHKLTPSKLGNEFAFETMAFAWKGFGFGVFGDSRSNIGFLRPSDPYAKVTSLIDTAAIIGYATPFSFFGITIPNLNIGFAGKYMARGILYDMNNGDTTVDYGLGTLIDMFQTSKIATNCAYAVAQGPAADIGLSLPINLFGATASTGLTFRNIGANFTATKTINGVSQKVKVQIPFESVIGLGLTTPTSFLGVTSVTWALDYAVISVDKSFFKNTHLGLEAMVFNWDWLKLRGGLNQGYVVGGVGISWGILHLDYAYNQEALGDEVGINSYDYHLISIGIAN